MNSNLWFIIIGAAAVTYCTRFPLLICTGSKYLPGWLPKYLQFIAPAVLTALIVPLIFVKQGKPDFSLGNEYVIAAGVSVLTAYFTKNTLITVIAGVVTVGIVVFLF